MAAYLQMQGVEAGLAHHEAVNDVLPRLLPLESAEETVPDDQEAAVILVQTVEGAA